MQDTEIMMLRGPTEWKAGHLLSGKSCHVAVRWAGTDWPCDNILVVAANGCARSDLPAVYIVTRAPETARSCYRFSFYKWGCRITILSSPSLSRFWTPALRWLVVLERQWENMLWVDGTKSSDTQWLAPAQLLQTNPGFSGQELGVPTFARQHQALLNSCSLLLRNINKCIRNLLMLNLILIRRWSNTTPDL